MHNNYKLLISFILGAIISIGLLNLYFYWNNPTNVWIFGIILTGILSSIFYLAFFKLIIPYFKENSVSSRGLLISLALVFGIILSFATPFPGFFEKQPVKLTISNTGEKDALADNSYIGIRSVNIDGKKLDFNNFKYISKKIDTYNLSNFLKIFSFDNFRVKGKWSYHNLIWPVDNFIILKTKGDSVEWESKAKYITIFYVIDQSFGTAKINYDGKVVSENTYSNVPALKPVTYEIMPAKITFFYNFMKFISATGKFLLLFTAFLCLGIASLKGRIRLKDINMSRKRIFIYSAIFMSIFGLYLLAYYPAIMDYDTIISWKDMVFNRIDDFHPAIWTFITWLFTRIWFSPTPIAITLIVCFALTLGYFLYKLEKSGIPKKIIILTISLICLMPIHGLVAINIGIDTPYSISLLLLTFLTFLIATSDGIWLYPVKNRVFLFLVLFFVAFVRHNGTLPAFATIIGITLINIKDFKKTLPILATLILTIYAVRYQLYPALNINFDYLGRALAMPSHQVGAMLQYNAKIDSQDKKILNGYMPITLWKNNYNKFWMDNIIFNPQSKVKNKQLRIQDKMKFLQIWFKLVINNPKIALKEWSDIASIMTKVNSAPNGDGTLYIWKSLIPNNLGLKEHSLLPGFKSLINNICNFTERSSLDWLFWRSALYFYIALFLGIIFIFRNRWRGALILFPFIFNEISYFLSVPAPWVRYGYPTILLATVIILVSFLDFKTKQAKNY